MGKVSTAAMDLKTSSFAHNINLHTTDGRVQSPPPPGRAGVNYPVLNNVQNQTYY